MRLDKAVALYTRTQGRYKAIERQRSNGVPAPILFCLHYRESDNNFRTHPHNGDPLNRRTYHVPAGRLPNKPPPYTFEESAEDAFYVVDRLQFTDWGNLESALDKTEAFNGLGYRRMGKPSPYNWSGTNQYTRGKYYADGKYSPTLVDQQLGVAAILLRMEQRGIKLPF